MMLRGNFAAIKNLRAIERFEVVGGCEFVVCSMSDGGNVIGWVRPSDRNVLFVCNNLASGAMCLSDLTADMTGWSVAGYKSKAVHKVCKAVVDEFSLGGAA
jgi:hypothetical protein